MTSSETLVAGEELELFNAKSGPGMVNIRLGLWTVAIVAGFLQSWGHRWIVNPDGISYLDIARACARGDWHSLVNGYWSPLYPFLLSIALRIFSPTAYWESTVAHLMNFGIFLLSFASLGSFLKTLFKGLRRKSRITAEKESLPDWALWSLGSAMWIYFALMFFRLDPLTPDLCVATLVYFAAALLLRMRAGKGTWLTYAGFGATLGLGYLAKQIMFPLALIFLGCCLLAVKPLRKSIPRTAITLLVFLLVASPFIGVLSKAKGRITVGDTGRINYAEFVDGATLYVHWQGGPRPTGEPVHPTRALLSAPPLFEFATPVKGTYPPWYDPSYWYEGIVPAFSLRNQLRAIRYTTEEYAGILSCMGGLLVGFLGLFLLAQAHSSVWWGFLQVWPVWLPAAAALGLYALVCVEGRYVAPFLVLLWMGLFAGLRFASSGVARLLQQCLTFAIVIFLGLGIAWLAGRNLIRVLAPEPFVNWEVAEGLHDIGVQPGDRVGSIGNSLWAYWAHLAGVKIVAEIPAAGAPSYWAASPQMQSVVLDDFSKAGAKVVVTDQEPPANSLEGWRSIGDTGCFVHTLSLATF